MTMSVEKMALLTACRKLHGLQDDKQKLEDKRKDLNKAIDELRYYIIPSIMEDMEIDKVTYTGLGTVYLTPDLHASILASNKEQAFKWLTKHGHGDLYTMTIHPSTLKAFVKEQMQEGNQLPFEIFNITPFTKAVIRKS
jgi:hypothetical protein